MVVLSVQAPRLAAALTDRTGRSGWCRSGSSLHAPRPRHDAAEADAAWDEPGESISLDEIEAEFGR